MASLRAGNTSAQIQALQRNVLDQLRQGVAPADVISDMRRQFSGQADVPFGTPAFPNFGQPPGGGGGFPGGGAPGGMGGGFPGGRGGY